MRAPHTRRAMLGGALALPALALPGLAWASTPAPEVRTLTAKGGRAVAVSHWRARGRRRGVILFSHGALSSPSRYPAMIDRWTSAGYEIHAPLHVDSLEHPHRADFPGLTGWAARIGDMRAVSAAIGGDYLAVGHSYGALTALVMGGCEATIPPGTEGPLRDPRARCAVAFSPPPPILSLIDGKGYAALAVPALITTGTRDLLPNDKTNPESWRRHLAAYEAAAPGHDRAAAIFDGADHYFGGAICDYAQPGPAQTVQLDHAIAASLLFLQTFGGSDRRDGPAFLARLRRLPATEILYK